MEASHSSDDVLTPSILVIPHPSWILLRHNLWFDPNFCALIDHQGQSILLTPRQARLLAILLTAPATFHPTYMLARRLSQRGKPKITPHSVHQTISGLHHKLKCVNAGSLLHNRPQVGYAIVPDVASPTQPNIHH